MKNTLIPFEKSSTLDQVLIIMEQLALWLIRSGVGHTEFATAIKPIFLQQSLEETTRIKGKQTDSAISLLSGLHRRDVSALRENIENKNVYPTTTATSIPAQVIGKWIAQEWPDQIPQNGTAPSFEALVQSISKDIHPRSVQQELERLQIVSVDQEHIRLLQQAFTPDPQALETRQMVAQNIADHLAAAVHNLTSASPNKFLEQSVFADGLTRESALQLEQLSREIWQTNMLKVLRTAIELCEKDQNMKGNNQRFRLGIFSFTDNENI